MDPTRELISGRHVRLREMRESDAPHVVEWRNRPEIRPVSGWWRMLRPFVFRALGMKK